MNGRLCVFMRFILYLYFVIYEKNPPVFTRSQFKYLINRPNATYLFEVSTRSTAVLVRTSRRMHGVKQLNLAARIKHCLPDCFRVRVHKRIRSSSPDTRGNRCADAVRIDPSAEWPIRPFPWRLGLAGDLKTPTRGCALGRQIALPHRFQKIIGSLRRRLNCKSVQGCQYNKQ